MACASDGEKQSVNSVDRNSGQASNATRTTTPLPVAATPDASGKKFEKALEFNDIKFLIYSANSAAGNSVTITPSGLSQRNEAFTVKVKGEVYGAEVGDLNVDQSPEVYVYYREPGPEKRSGLVAFASNKKASISEINLPAPDPESKEYSGYNGEDEFTVIENVLSRRFPVFNGSGPNAKKTGKTRTIQYKIKPGEAVGQLFVLRSDEY
jgi:hypothetical protein